MCVCVLTSVCVPIVIFINEGSNIVNSEMFE